MPLIDRQVQNRLRLSGIQSSIFDVAHYSHNLSYLIWQKVHGYMLADRVFIGPKALSQRLADEYRPRASALSPSPKSRPRSSGIRMVRRYPVLIMRTADFRLIGHCLHRPAFDLDWLIGTASEWQIVDGGCRCNSGNALTRSRSWP